MATRVGGRGSRQLPRHPPLRYRPEHAARQPVTTPDLCTLQLAYRRPGRDNNDGPSAVLAAPPPATPAAPGPGVGGGAAGPATRPATPTTPGPGTGLRP